MAKHRKHDNPLGVWAVVTDHGNAEHTLHLDRLDAPALEHFVWMPRSHRKPSGARRRVVVPALAMLALAGCGEDTGRIPERGLVTDAAYNPEWIQWMPGVTTCGKYGCTTSPGYPIVWPEDWKLTVTDLHNPDWRGTMSVSEDVYERCNLREVWPECSQEGTGDLRPKL